MANKKTDISKLRQMLRLYAQGETGRPYSRRALFEDVERSALHPLPELPYEFKRHQQATIS